MHVHIRNDNQCRSRSVGFFRGQLIWIYTVCKGRIYPGSAGQGLNLSLNNNNNNNKIGIIIINITRQQKMHEMSKPIISGENYHQFALNLSIVWVELNI